MALISKVDLKSQTVKELGQRARDLGIPGSGSMRKDELIKALSNKLRAIKAAKTRAKKKKSVSGSTTTKRKRTTRPRKKQTLPVVKLKTNLVKLDMSETDKQELPVGQSIGHRLVVFVQDKSKRRSNY